MINKETYKNVYFSFKLGFLPILLIIIRPHITKVMENRNLEYFFSWIFDILFTNLKNDGDRDKTGSMLKTL